MNNKELGSHLLALLLAVVFWLYVQSTMLGLTLR